MHTKATREQLDELEVGDIVERFLAGIVGIKCIVIRRDDKIITVSVPRSKEEVLKEIRQTLQALGLLNVPEFSQMPEWDFNAETGLEIDEDLKWDGVTYSGSYLYIPSKK